MRLRVAGLLPLLVAGAALAVLYGRLLIPGTAFVDRDISGMHLPMLTALERAAEHGVPYWNPMVHGGQPLLTNPHYAAFYPPIWLVKIFPPHALVGWLVAMHAVLAFIGTWRLARHWGCQSPAAAFAAIGFAGSGAICSSSSMLNLFMGLAWLPWIMVWGDRVLGCEERQGWHRTGVKLALALAAQVLAGSPVTPVLSVLALGCLSLGIPRREWRRALRLVVAGTLALLLSAVQILPTLRHLSASARSEGLQLKMATTWSTPPVRILELIWPRLFGDPSRIDSYLYPGYPGSESGVPLIMSLYCGALVLALFGGSLWRLERSRLVPLLAMIGGGLFLALGRNNPFYMKFLIGIPPFSIIRFPEKFILLTTIGIALIAALAWQDLLARPAAARSRTVRGAILVALVAFTGSVLLYLAPMIAPELTMDLLEGVSEESLVWQEHDTSGSEVLPEKVLMVRAGLLGRELFVSVVVWALTAGALLLHRWRRISTEVLALTVLAIIGLDLAYYARGFNRTVPAATILEPPRGLDPLPPTKGRVFSDAILFGNRVVYFPDSEAEIPSELRRSLDRLDPYIGNLWGYSYALNQDPDLMLTRSAQHALRTLIQESGLWQRGWSDDVYAFLGAWNIGIVVRRRSPAAQLEERRRTDRMPVPALLIENPEVLPRYRFVNEVAIEPDLASAIAQVRSRRFRLGDFDAITAQPGQGSIGLRSFEPTARVIAVDEKGSEIVVEYESQNPAFLVAALTADRDWRASIDSDDLPIRETALGQMGFELPAGRHRLLLRYRNPAVLWGMSLSLVAIALTFASLGFRARTGV